MEKMRMETKNITDENIKKILELFPNVATEAVGEDGKLKTAIDFEKLKQELSDIVIDGEESYDFTWVGKKRAIVEANRPIRKTLRPDRESSVNWDTTQNIYIEGDNLDALKLLQESYLGKIKIIYIDPPYNTGKDFVYRDNFTQDKDSYNEQLGIKDGEGNRLFQNTESNGRFHSDWCSMIYPRLKLARDLLTDDGVIFISIDDNEVRNLKNICDEVFGEENFVADFIRKTKSQTNDAKTGVNYQHEFLLTYAKNKTSISLIGPGKDFSNYKNPDNDAAGAWVVADPSARSGGPNSQFPITNSYTGTVDFPPQGRYWAFAKTTFDEWVKCGKVKFKTEVKNGERGFIVKKYLAEVKSDKRLVDSLSYVDNMFMNQMATKEINNLFKEALFTYPKPTVFIKKLLATDECKDSIILDFFSGSATTAHAVMQLNAEDGGSRKFIMVQLPEKTAENSEAYKAGYKNICEIGKERIRRAGKQILENTKQMTGGCSSLHNTAESSVDSKKSTKKVDIGFRVFKVDDTNLKDVYYTPKELNQKMLLELESNIKEDRTDEDLLYGCLLDWGVELSLPHKLEVIDGKRVHIVDNDALIACFEDAVPESVVRKIAEMKPMRVVFRDSSFTDDDNKINVEEIFKLISPETVIKVI